MTQKTPTWLHRNQQLASMSWKFDHMSTWLRDDNEPEGALTEMLVGEEADEEPGRMSNVVAAWEGVAGDA